MWSKISVVLPNVSRLLENLIGMSKLYPNSASRLKVAKRFLEKWPECKEIQDHFVGSQEIVEIHLLLWF